MSARTPCRPASSSAAAWIAAAAIGFAAVPALSQTSGLVSIELTQVSASMAERLRVDEARIPMSIMVPPELAAEVCGITPGAPSPQVARRGDGCMARRSSPDLDRLITTRMAADEPPPTATMGNAPAPAGATPRPPQAPEGGSPR